MKPTAWRWVAIILVLIGSASYGLLSPLVKMAYERGWNDVQVSASQVTMGTVLLWVLLLVNPRAWSNPFRTPWIRLSAIGIFGLALTTFFLNNSLSRLDASLAIVLLFQFTWMTIVLECGFDRKWPTKYQVGAVILVMIGTLLAVDVSGTSMSELDGVGVAFGLLSGFTYSVFLFFTGRVRTTAHPILKSVIMLTAALPVIYIIYPPAAVFQSNTGSLVLWGLLLGFLGQALPAVAFNIGIPRIGATLAAMLASMELPVAITAAFLILKEPVGWMQWAGMGLILIGIFVSERQPKREEEPKRSE
ncbi:EamA family transporter [Paenibacillus sp. HJGM_3]|uniref:EamA family transporter n=1 Tax=Paenibacillus sp. HJGM_3 TaxID=3379816 RepID=UPI00385BE044